MTKHTRRDPAEYQALLARRQAERLTFAQLSIESGVPIATLQYWARKLRGPELPGDSTNPSGPFIEVDLSTPAHVGIEVLLDRDMRVVVRPGFDPVTLRAVIDTLTC